MSDESFSQLCQLLFFANTGRMYAVGDAQDTHLLTTIINTHFTDEETCEKCPAISNVSIITHIMQHITDANVKEYSKLLKWAVKLYPGSNSTLFDQQLQTAPISLTNLSIANVLLTSTSTLATVDALTTYLQRIYDCTPQEIKYFSTHILPIFFTTSNSSAEALKCVWNTCQVRRDLSLLPSIPKDVLLSEAFLRLTENDVFWEILVEGLEAIEGYKYKLAMFTFRAVLELLKSEKFTFSLIEHISPEYCDSFEKLTILLDISREKQLHLIQPSLCLLERVKNLPRLWKTLIYRKLLQHSHIAVGYNTFFYLAGENYACEEIFPWIFHVLNKNDDSQLCLSVFERFQRYCSELREDEFQILVAKSVAVIWTPVGFYRFYKCVFSVDSHRLPHGILLDVIRNCKRLPQKYIRNGAMHLIYEKVQKNLSQCEIETDSYFAIILELLADEAYYKYGTKVINNHRFHITDNILSQLQVTLCTCKQLTHLEKTQIDFLIEITERRNLPANFVMDLYSAFKSRRYSYPVLDRLSYLYMIKGSDLQEYLLERLETEEQIYAIRHTDKPNAKLIAQSTSICTNLCSSKSQILLAFEILYYMTRSSYNYVYEYWFAKILDENTAVPSTIASHLLDLLIKIPTAFGMRKFSTLLRIYEQFFDTQPDCVVVKVFRNIDFVLEGAKLEHLDFFDAAWKRLRELKSRQDLESGIRYLLRSIALNCNVMCNEVLLRLLSTLYQSALSADNCGAIVVYYSAMYFKYMHFDRNVFPLYQFLLYPNEILTKSQRAEYQVCRRIYNDTHSFNPYFRAVEVREWVLEDLLFNIDSDKTTATVTFLLSHYQSGFGKRYFPDSQLHLEKLRTMQILAFLIPYYTETIKEQVMNVILESFTVESHQASVRYLMQYILIQILKNNEEALKIIEPFIDITSKNPSTISSLLSVIYGLDLINDRVDFSHKVIEIALPLMLGAHFKLRYLAQQLLRETYHRHRNNAKFKKYDALCKAVQVSLKATTGQETVLQSLNLEFTVCKFISDHRPWSSHKKLIYIVSVYIPEVANVCPAEWEYLKIKYFWSKYSKENLSEAIENFQISDEQRRIQMKITPWETMFDGVKNSDRSCILVASLIESPANLGGIARTCEIFGVESLILNNAKLFEDEQFKSLSMSSESWLQINEVKCGNLRPFLLTCKDRGYQVIGVEQTCDSVSLEKFKFSKKTVIVLGNERSGLPAPLMSLMDDCVEIPQLGVVRSLNVHVAGALVLWEYVQQHLLNESAQCRRRT